MAPKSIFGDMHNVHTLDLFWHKMLEISDLKMFQGEMLIPVNTGLIVNYY